MLPSPLNLAQWVSEHRHLLKPPVGNKLIWEDTNFMVFAVGGPNARKDFHINHSDEFFYQIEGTVNVRIIENGRPRDVFLRAGEIFLLPGLVPHSPQRPAGTVGLVIERKTAETEPDSLHWYCEGCDGLLYEESFHVTNIATQLQPVFARFYGNIVLRTCKQCGAVMEPPAPLLQQ